MTLQEKISRRLRRKQRKPIEIEQHIPPYLLRFITPYKEDFCFTRVHHYRLVAQLMSEGFLPIATEGVLLPKLHKERCVVSLPQDLHISKSVRKKSKRFRVTVNTAFAQVVEGCKAQHGKRCWLYDPLVEAFQHIYDSGKVDCTVFDDGKNPTTRDCPVRIYSMEIWNQQSGQLVGGELGYTVGSIYTSLTGFASEDSAGSVQLAALGRMLAQLGFSLWDLGMAMDYKFSLGCHLMPRAEYVAHVRAVREAKGSTVLPSHGRSYNAKDLIDQTIPTPLLLSNEEPTKQPTSQEHNQETPVKGQQHQPPYDNDSENSAVPHRNKKLKNSGSMDHSKP